MSWVCTIQQRIELLWYVGLILNQKDMIRTFYIENRIPYFKCCRCRLIYTKQSKWTLMRKKHIYTDTSTSPKSNDKICTVQFYHFKFTTWRLADVYNGFQSENVYDVFSCIQTWNLKPQIQIKSSESNVSNSVLTTNYDSYQ